MDGENETNKGGAAVATPEGASGAASPTVQSGAGESAPASPSGASAGASKPRMYSADEMSKAVQSRLAEEQKKYAPWKEFGDHESVKARLEKADRYEKALKGDEPQGPTPEEKELRDLLSKNGFVRKEDVEGMRAELKAIGAANHDAHTKAGRGEIARLAQEKLGSSDKNVLEMLEDRISVAIARDEESLKAWNSGDVSVISKHFESVLVSSFDPIFKSASSRYSGGKAKDRAEVPPMMPKGGVQAPASQERKLTGEELRNAAWAFLKQRDSQA